jgi:SAM-dependent methyltransferase
VQGGPGLSRRALFGAGLGRIADAGLARGGEAGPRTPPPPPAPPFAGWGEGDSGGLGARLDPVAATLLEACGVSADARVLVACAGDGVLARAAARAGARVTAVEADAERVERGRVLCDREGAGVTWVRGPLTRMPVGDGAHDVVVSLFGASYAEDPRAAAAELVRVVRPGGAIGLTAWTGFVGALLHAAGGPARRSQRWARYETAYRHFFDFPDLDVREASVPWTFASAAEAAGELAATERARGALPDLLARFGTETAGGILVDAAYAIVFARRP